MRDVLVMPGYSIASMLPPPENVTVVSSGTKSSASLGNVTNSASSGGSANTFLTLLDHVFLCENSCTIGSAERSFSMMTPHLSLRRTAAWPHAATICRISSTDLPSTIMLHSSDRELQ